VTFRDTSGLEAYFDVLVEYIGHVTDDASIMKIYDKEGILREILTSRLATMVPTEQAIEAGGPM
jgi:hypothetical protein